jgi:hypothetical protein
MTTPGEADLGQLLGRPVVDEEGRSVGLVECVFDDERTGGPGWIGVLTGTFRHHHVLVPARGAENHGRSLRVPWARERIKHAPTYDEQDQGGLLGIGQYRARISKDKEQVASAHYGIEEDAGVVERG